MTTVAKLIRYLQQHNPRAIVVLPSRYGVVRPLHIASISAVALNGCGPVALSGHGLERYTVSEDDEGTPGVLLECPTCSSP